MDTRKQYINKNIDELWQKTKNLDLFIRRLYESEYFYKRIEIKDEDFCIDKWFIFDNLIQNDRDYKEMILLLLYSGNDEAAMLLGPDFCADLVDFKITDPQKGFKPIFSFGEEQEFIKLKEPEHSLSNVYPFTSGYCLLINNYFTTGTFIEMQKFRNIFHLLNFDVQMEKNLTAGQIKDKLVQISTSDVLLAYDVFVLMIITHGGDGEVLYGFDSQEISIESILDLFNEKNCKSLIDKPKLFFFNSCRCGADSESVEPHDDTAAIEPHPNLVQMNTVLNNTLQRIKFPPIRQHFLVCYATHPGYFAYVNRYKGTIFGQVFAKVLIDRVLRRTMNNIMTTTNRELQKLLSRNQIQVCEWKQNLTHEIYLRRSHEKNNFNKK